MRMYSRLLDQLSHRLWQTRLVTLMGWHLCLEALQLVVQEQLHQVDAPNENRHQ